MLLLDVNVLVYAFRADSPRHAEYNEWLRAQFRGHEPVALADRGFARFPGLRWRHP